MKKIYDLLLCVVHMYFEVIVFFKKAWDVVALTILLIWLSLSYWDDVRALNEAWPTNIAMQAFPQSYDGEYWLRLTGRLAVEHRQVTTQRRGRNEETLVTYVPLVAPDWDVRQPVHAVAVFEEYTEPQFRKWLQNYEPGRVTVTGVVSRNGAFSARFPNLEEGSPCVFVRHGRSPKSIGDLMGLTAVLLFIWLIVHKLKKWLTPAKPEAAN